MLSLFCTKQLKKFQLYCDFVTVHQFQFQTTVISLQQLGTAWKTKLHQKKKNKKKINRIDFWEDECFEL